MKKWFLMTTLIMVVLLILGEMSLVYAGGKGRKYGKGWGVQKPKVTVISDKDEYYLGEKAHFIVDITLPKCRKMKMYEVYATFPDATTPVELLKTGPTQFKYITELFTEVGSKFLTTHLYHRGTHRAIESLQRNAERFRRQIACLEKLLEDPQLPGWMRNIIRHVIESLKRRLWAIEWVISRLRGMYVAEGSKTIEVMYRPPEAPTSLLCEREEAPDNVRTRKPYFSAVFVDLDPGDMGTDYQVQVSQDEQFTQIVWDSGKAWLTEFPASGERCEDIGCGVKLSDETEYWWRIRFWDHHDLEGQWSQTAWFKIGDLTPPEPPVVEEQPPEGEVLSTSTVHFSGRAEPGSTVLIYGSPTLLATVPVGPDGLWAVDLTLPDGWHNLVIYVRDPAGNLSTPWTVRFAIDTTPPSTGATPAGGTYAAALTVELTASDNLDIAPVIYWTVDGSDPDLGSPVYLEPIVIATNTMLKFRAVDGVSNWESVRTEEYLIFPPPAADFSATPARGRAPLNVQFTGESIGDITTWEWDFNNDGVVDSTEKNPSYTYYDASWYTVKLTVSGRGGSDTCVREMFVLVGDNVWYVDNRVVSSGNGTSWDTAFKTIQESLTRAEDRDLVLVADGTYSGMGNKDLDFGGKAIAVKSQNGPENCVINCEGSGRGFNFDSGETHAAVVEGFTIRKGSTTDAGGAVRCEHASPTIRDCIMIENIGHYGGAISCISSNAHIYRCVMKNNSTSDLFLGYGGAIYGLVFNGILSECIIVNNKAAWGGAMRCAWSEALIARCRIESNTATFGGGGIFVNGQKTMKIRNCLVSRNFAKYGAGIYAYYYSLPSITNCTIANNSASESGGGISSVTASPTLDNTVVSGNAAPTGNQVFTSSPESTVTLNQCNYADNSIDPNNIAGLGTVTEQGICIHEAPLFVDAAGGNYRLQATSPCIDTGNNDLVPLGVTKDSDGNDRIVGDVVDIGAHEYQILTAIVVTESLMPNHTLPGKEKIFKIDILNTGQYEIVLDSQTQLEFWDEGSSECKFSARLDRPMVVIPPGQVRELQFQLITIPQDLLPGKLALRLLAVTTTGYHHALNVSDRLTLPPNLLIIDTSNSPYVTRGHCDFHDIWIKENAIMEMSGSRVVMTLENVFVDGTWKAKEERTEPIICGNTIVIGKKGKIDAAGKGHKEGEGPGAGMHGEASQCGGGGGASNAENGKDALGATPLWGKGGSKYSYERDRMGSGGGGILAVASSEGGGSIALILKEKLVNHGIIDASGKDGRPVPGTGCGTGGGGAGAISIWVPKIERSQDGIFKAKGGKGGGKGQVPHSGGDGADGSVIICYEDWIEITDANIKCSLNGKIIKKITDPGKEFWPNAKYFFTAVYSGRTLLAEYDEKGQRDQEFIIQKILAIAPSEDLNDQLLAKLECKIDKITPEMVDSKKIVPAEIVIDVQGRYCLRTKDFLTVNMTTAVPSRVDFERSVFVAKVLVGVYLEEHKLREIEYTVLAGKWPSSTELTEVVGREKGALLPPQGAHIGLEMAGKRQWTIITQDRLSQAVGMAVDYSKFICYDWSLGIITKAQGEDPTVFDSDNDADTAYGNIGLSRDANFNKEGAKVILMKSKGVVGPEHAIRGVGFGYFSGKHGVEELVVHKFEHMHLPPDVKPEERKANQYGDGYRSYR